MRSFDRVVLVALALLLCAIWGSGCASYPIAPPSSTAAESSELPQTAPWPLDDSKGYKKYLPSANSTLAEAKRAERIEKKVNEIIGGQCLKDELLKPGLKLKETKDSPLMVYERLLKSRVDAIISYYYQPFTKAVAYAEGNTFYFNRAKIGGWTDCDFVSTSLHETTHLPPLNYSHAYNYYYGREFTVPYLMNQIAEKCCK